MHGKEFFMDMLNSYFIVVTLITAATFIMGVCLFPNESFGYSAFAAPLIYGACGVLPNFVMYSKRELTVKELLVRKVMQFVLIEVLVLTAAFGGSDIAGERLKAAIAMGISIFVIFVISHVIAWMQDCMAAKKMTDELIRFQQSVK